MSENKLLKDPIYGYIHIPEDLAHVVVDSPEFQRLRRISQTSYSPLFSSAVHNRFVHSIGVYHLGCLASESLYKSIKELGLETEISENSKDLRRIFQYACLLHDVGHSPFSHTGENFYLPHYEGKKTEEDYKELHKKLIDIVGSENFENDIPKSPSQCAAPHEVMSAIVGLKSFADWFSKTEDKEFFARCITGYRYNPKTDVATSEIKNCFIEMLNSSLIDVDKLDYLIRDAFVTGFSTVDIDYARLLEAITIYKDEQDIPKVGFRKSALSVIENAIYAHDSERKWIQNHPVILYGNLLVTRIIELLNKELNTSSSRLFSLESLSVEGQTLKKGKSSKHIRLLSDDDIIHLAKGYYSENSFVQEYFDRRKQMHALWKSEAEYKAAILGDVLDSPLEKKIQTAFIQLGKYIENEGGDTLINKELQERIEKELSDLNNESKRLTEADIRQQRSDKSQMLKLVKCLNKFAEAGDYSEGFILISAKQFSSGFSKPDFADLQIVFNEPQGIKVYPFNKIASSFDADEASGDKFFHLFYKRSYNHKARLSPNNLSKLLISEFVNS